MKQMKQEDEMAVRRLMVTYHHRVLGCQPDWLRTLTTQPAGHLTVDRRVLAVCGASRLAVVADGGDHGDGGALGWEGGRGRCSSFQQQR